MPNTEIDSIRSLLRAQPRPIGFAARRQRIDAIGSVDPIASDIRLTHVDAGGVPGKWSIAPTSNPASVPIFFHGGG